MTCATFSFCSLTKRERGENSAHHMTKRDVVPRYGDILSGHYGESTTAGFQQSTQQVNPQGCHKKRFSRSMDLASFGALSERVQSMSDL